MTDRILVNPLRLSDLAGEIVAAYVSNNPVPASELPALIARVHGAVAALGSITPRTVTVAGKPDSVQIRKSVQPDGIVSFIDGCAYKTLKRHLTAHGLTPHSYRSRYGLPNDYPMVAPNYARVRSQLAKQIGLGRPGAMAERGLGKQSAA